MGADLYNKRLFNGNYDIGLGYYRDSYNNSSTLWACKLSWWKDIGGILDKYEYDEDKGGYEPKCTNEILELIKLHPHPTPKDKYYIKLLEFLQHAVDNNDYVSYSI